MVHTPFQLSCSIFNCLLEPIGPRAYNDLLGIDGDKDSQQDEKGKDSHCFVNLIQVLKITVKSQRWALLKEKKDCLILKMKV